jgi:hypothetical protein
MFLSPARQQEQPLRGASLPNLRAELVAAMHCEKVCDSSLFAASPRFYFLAVC